MTLTVLQSLQTNKRSSRTFFTHVVYLDPQRQSYINNITSPINYFDYEEVQERTQGGATLEITFDKDYEVGHEQHSDYYANVHPWIVRLVSPRSRNSGK